MSEISKIELTAKLRKKYLVIMIIGASAFNERSEKERIEKPIPSRPA